MLQLLKKYQRFFYATIALVVIVSLISAGSLRRSTDARDATAVFTTPGGARFARWQMDQLESFLSLESLEKNPLNDGVLSSDFLNSPLSEAILAHRRDLVVGDLRKTREWESKWRPYRHPHLNYLSQDNLWRYFCPELTTHLRAFGELEIGREDDDLFAAKRALFQAQSQFPQERLRRIIWQQQQANPAQIDPLVAERDFELFGYGELRSWFGPHFLRMAAQVILLGSETAQQQGLFVTDREARVDLLARAALCWKLMEPSQPPLEPQALNTWLQQLCRQVNLTEVEATSLWRHILLFRRWVCSHRQRWSLDASAPIALEAFASQAKQVRLLTLHESLQVSDQQTWEHFETYCRAVSKDAATSSELPHQFYSAEELRARAPQFVQAKCRVRYTAISRDQLRAQIPAKEVLQWILEEKNWQLLCENISGLAKDCSDERARAQALERLAKSPRDRVDELARRALSPQWESRWGKALEGPGQELEFSLNAAGLEAPFPLVKDKAGLTDLIWRAHSGDLTAQKSLLHYTEGEQWVISLRILECSDWELMTWQQARAKGAIEAYIAAKGSAQGKTEGTSSPRQKSTNLAAESPGEVKPDLIRFKSAAQNWAQKHYPGQSGAWLLMRQIQTLASCLRDLRQGRERDLLSTSPQELGFESQWSIRESRCRISRGDERAKLWPELFEGDREWSSIQWQRSPMGFCQWQKGETALDLDKTTSRVGALVGLERIRAQIARHLDEGLIRGWAPGQMAHLVPSYSTGDPDEEGR